MRSDALVPARSFPAGKTLESLSLLAYLKQYRNYDGPHLIIVPKSTSSNWLREVNRWTNNLSVFRFHGNQEERDALKPQVKLNDITITTYEMVILEKSFFAKQKWKYIYIDEAHRIKVSRTPQHNRAALVAATGDAEDHLSAIDAVEPCDRRTELVLSPGTECALCLSVASHLCLLFSVFLSCTERELSSVSCGSHIQLRASIAHHRNAAAEQPARTR